jgi:hypothetical protein
MKSINKYLLIALVPIIAGSCSLFEKKKTASTDKTTTTTAYDFRNSMRKLWEDNITWTRNVMVCLTGNGAGADQAIARLQKNQDDITNTLVLYYPDATPKLSDLMHEHVNLTTEMLKGAKGKKKKNGGDIEKKWDDNADAIADYFAKANPNAKSDNLKTMVRDHMKLTKDEVDARKKKDYAADVQAYDKLHDATLIMADSMSVSIIRQFPDKF